MTLSRDVLAHDLLDTAFSPPTGASPDVPRVGAEVELIAVDVATRRPCAVERSTLPLLRAHGARRGWREEWSGKGAPVFHTPDGGRLTLEPGGQVELSAAPARSASALLASLRATVVPLRAAAIEAGTELLAVGIDPRNPVERAPLQLRGERYARMAEYFAGIDPAGARMMRQTAAFQLSLDLGDPRADAPRRWRVLNAAAPLVVAIFANSPRYAGAATGCRSWRAEGWRRLDPRRTGVLPAAGGTPEACAEEYLDFALAAPAIMRRGDGGEYLPFAAWCARDREPPPTLDDWRTHLTTLFPEVRPRGYLELRSADAVAPEWYAAPVALLTGALYHAPALAEAELLLGDPDAELLRRAGVCALRDPRLARAAADLARIALAGCKALGPAWISGADLESAREFFERYTFRGRSPADDADAAAEESGARGEAAD
ncbi:MAG TPA: glutamate-cysteine ligase family protein [Gemmatimonadaceae bacterium]|nr:glutamate-cysteine ligase family protein [Gemmatimonadaceae bacterium]